MTSPFILLLTLLLALSPLLAADKPNIIVIMTDDQGYGDLSITGSKQIKTPAIDRIGHEGAWLTNFYVSPVCTPTRAAFMTGRHPQRTRAYDTYIGRAMMDPAEITIAEILREAGYATGLSGKWHLGDCYPTRPSDQGFDQSLIHLGGGLAQPCDPLANDNRYTNPILFHDNVEKPFTGYCTDIFFDHAIRFIDSATASNKPFFSFIALNAPHGPFHDVPAKNYANFKGKTKNDKEARVFAMIENVDENVAKLLDHLDKQNLADNTLVIFLTDNGPNSMRYNGGFKGMKAWVNEGGIRTSFLARWPAKIKAGHKNATNAAHFDLLPTFCEIAGAKKPTDRKIDGTSVLPLLLGETPKSFPSERPLVFQWHRGFPQKGLKFGVVQGNWKLVNRSDKANPKRPARNFPDELFDLSQDPGEKTNLAKQNPAKAKQLRAVYHAWFADISTPTTERPDPFASPRIVIGTDHETHTRLTKQDWQRELGTSWGTRGTWLCHAAQPATYRAEIILEKPAEQDLPIQLELGPDTPAAKATLKAGQSVLTLDNITIPTGPLPVRASLQNKAQPIPHLYQVHLIRK